MLQCANKQLLYYCSNVSLETLQAISYILLDNLQRVILVIELQTNLLYQTIL